MKERIATLEGNVSTIQQTLNSLITKIGEIEGTVSQSENTMTTMQVQVSDLTAEVNVIKKELAE